MPKRLCSPTPSFIAILPFFQRFPVYYNTKSNFWQIKRGGFEKILAQIEKMWYSITDKSR